MGLSAGLRGMEEETSPLHISQSGEEQELALQDIVQEDFDGFDLRYHTG